MHSSTEKKIAIVGGGAAGFFAALKAAEEAKVPGWRCKVDVFEASSQFLKKVKISGGGRCNVTHNLSDDREFLRNYPRGEKELIGPFQQFNSLDTLAWFKERGVTIISEDDGRMFPVTHDSQTIIDCFLSEAQRLNVGLHKDSPVSSVASTTGQFELCFRNGIKRRFDRLLLATGSSKIGYKLAELLGHRMTEMAPSLFTFKVKHPMLDGLMGLSFENAEIKIVISDQFKAGQKGPLLITHWGLSGPAVLKLSAWGAREFKRSGYRADLRVNWLALKNQEQAEALLVDIKNQSGASVLKNIYPDRIPKRFWRRLLQEGEVVENKKWSDVSKKEIRALAALIYDSKFEIKGQSRFKEEFVECGGVDLKEVNFKTMESKICPGLYFSGELLDIDGITGGFNFQNAWTTGFIAGKSMINF